MEIAAITLATLGIFATIYVAYLVDRRSSRLIERIGDILSAEMPPEKYNILLRLLNDKSGHYGWIKRNDDGKWVIVWELVIKESIKL